MSLNSEVTPSKLSDEDETFAQGVAEVINSKTSKMTNADIYEKSIGNWKRR